jgi:hypothetical protein
MTFGWVLNPLQSTHTSISRSPLSCETLASATYYLANPTATMAPIGALDSGNPDSEDESKKADRLAARAARFNKQLVGNRHKEVSDTTTGAVHECETSG